MFCENCGNTIKDEMKFCSKCGNKVKTNNPINHTFNKNKTEVENFKVDIYDDNSIDEKKKYILILIDSLEKIIQKKVFTLTHLKEFGEILKNEKEIPQQLPEEFVFNIKFKDILGVFIKGFIISVIITSIAFHGEEITFRDIFQCAAFFWFIIGGYTLIKRKSEYEKQREYIANKRKEMLKQKNMSKYQYEDEILGLINKNYKIYIGNPIFNSASIRDKNKDVFQGEITNIIKFAEENKIGSAEFSDIIKLFYQNKHDCKINELQKNLNIIKEKYMELNAELEDLEDTNNIGQSLEMIDEIISCDAKYLTMTSNDYEKTLNNILKSMECVEFEIQKVKEQRKKSLESLQTNIPKYQEELAKISLRRKKYPDNELSSSFITEYKRKMDEVKEKMHMPIDCIRNKADKIEAEIQKDIEYLIDMIETEYNSRHKRIYGKPDNKLAAKFKNIYK